MSYFSPSKQTPSFKLHYPIPVRVNRSTLKIKVQKHYCPWYDTLIERWVNICPPNSALSHLYLLMVIGDTGN